MAGWFDILYTKLSAIPLGVVHPLGMVIWVASMIDCEVGNEGVGSGWPSSWICHYFQHAMDQTYIDLLSTQKKWVESGSSTTLPCSRCGFFKCRSAGLLLWFTGTTWRKAPLHLHHLLKSNVEVQHFCNWMQSIQLQSSIFRMQSKSKVSSSGRPTFLELWWWALCNQQGGLDNYCYPSMGLFHDR